MCSYEYCDVCRFFWQIYIKIPNDEPVETKKSFFFRRMTQNGDEEQVCRTGICGWLDIFFSQVLVDEDDKPLLNVIDEPIHGLAAKYYFSAQVSTTSLAK